MLNIVPIQFLAPLAYMILRVCVGILFLYFGRSHIKNRNAKKEAFLSQRLPYSRFATWYIALIEILVGALFILGLFTQVAAFIAMLYALKFILAHKHSNSSFLPNKLVYILIFFVSLSLFITGAGAFAFDLPI